MSSTEIHDAPDVTAHFVAAGGVKMIKNLLGAFRFTGVTFMPMGA